MPQHLICLFEPHFSPLWYGHHNFTWTMYLRDPLYESSKEMHKQITNAKHAVNILRPRVSSWHTSWLKCITLAPHTTTLMQHVTCSGL